MHVKKRLRALLALPRKRWQNAFLPRHLAAVVSTKQGCYDWKRHNYRQAQ
ncbi:hypothetical protein [Paraburkholderia dinghuensis]|nr:hypothetical protein [Paraburkholderia dinghuensis]